MMRKNVNGEYLIEVESEGDRLILYPQVIQSFGPIKETEDRFYFDYNVISHLNNPSYLI